MTKRDYKTPGVYQKGKKWGVFVSYKGVKTHLGVFNTYEEACVVRSNAQASLPKDERSCLVCEKLFSARSVRQKFCTPTCKGKWKYISHSVTTEGQYKAISGNWIRYLSRLQYSSGRKRDGLKRDDLLLLLEKQDYKCAISGLPLTCQLERGTKLWSNASIDRIDAGGPYSPENVQLVCRAVNSWRSDMPLEHFINVCRAVANHNQERLEVRDG